MTNLSKMLLTLLAVPLFGVASAQEDTLIETYEYTEYKDGFSGEEASWVISSGIPADHPLPFPYQDLEAILQFYCDGSDDVYLKFNGAPNIQPDGAKKTKIRMFANFSEWNAFLKQKNNLINKENALLEKWHHGYQKHHEYLESGKIYSPEVALVDSNGTGEWIAIHNYRKYLRMSDKVLIQVEHYAGTRYYTFHPKNAPECP